MSDTETPAKASAAKRGYRVGGETLSHDLRIRVGETDFKALQRYAKRKKTSAAAAARQILHDVLTEKK